MKPICVPCERFYRPKKNGFSFIEGMPESVSEAKPGKAEPEKWAPYKLWMGDLWACPDCGSEIVVGCGRAPLGEHYQPDFADRVQSYAPALKVNDC